jgi:hypothetical protein
MELKLTILLISTLTTNGLLALWAATSPRHWFLRTAVYLACLSPLLLVPAYEPFVLLALQGAVIAGGMKATRLYKRHRTVSTNSGGETCSPWRFSLLNLLLSMPFIGAAAAIASRMPALNSFAWQSIGVVAIGSGISILFAYGAARVAMKRRFALAALLLFMAMSLGPPIGDMDWLYLSLLEGVWSDSPVNTVTGFMNARGYHYTVEWSMIMLAIGATAFGICLLWRAATNRAEVARWRRWFRTAASLAFIGLCGIISLPAAAALFALMTPDPIPVIEIPAPNGRDDLVAAWKMMGPNQLIDSGNFDRDTASESQLITAVTEVAKAIHRVETGLPLPTMRTLDYSLGAEWPIDEIQKTRSIARAIDAAGRLAEVQGNFDESFRWHLNGVKYGFASRRGGMIIDGLVGVACSGVGCEGIYEIRDHLSSQQCDDAIAELSRLLANAEQFEDVEYRDRVWEQRTRGWMTHLWQWLQDDYGTAHYEVAYFAELARIRLLMAELAICRFRQSHGRLPANIVELASEALPEMPVDPFSSTNERLRFNRTSDGYVLYSVGRNGIDEEGMPPDDGISAGWSESGDLRLDVEYKREPPPAIVSGSDTESDEEFEVEEIIIEDESPIGKQPESE